VSVCLAIFACLLIGFVNLANSRDPNVIWIWSGGVTSDSAVIKARLRPSVNQAVVRIRPATDSAEARETVWDVRSEADANGIVDFRIDGLTSDTEYAYLIKAAGKQGPEGRFHTFADGPMSFRICFASCASTGSNHRIFSTIKDLRPLFFVHMGDFHYENIDRNDPSLFRGAFDKVLTSPRQANLYRSTPIAYVWDDHDFGPDDSDGTSITKEAALQAYQQCVPHYPLNRIDGEVRAIQQAFTVGRVRFLMLDSRSERTPEDVLDGPDKTMLGKSQLEWLRGELRNAEQRYPLIILVNPVSWITKNSEGKNDGWAPYSHERTLVADMIREAGLANRLVMLSGDGHMAAIDDGTNSNYASARSGNDKAFPVVQAAPLDRGPKIKGGPYSHGVSAPYGWLRIIKIKQFGLMDLEDDGNRIRVSLSCRDSKGSILKNLELKIECDRAGCTVIH
jgi:phosphodiesterase/alkaline phosphatase D-like protein